MVLLGDEAQVEARFSPLEIVLIFMQDRCTLCAEHTICSEIILDAPVVTHRQLGSCGTSFRSIWGTVLVSAQDWCTVCSEIILDAPNDTPQ
jgi:hypothetical protein